MVVKFFTYEKIEYEIVGDGIVIMSQIRGRFDHLIIPSEVFSPEGDKYKVIGFNKTKSSFCRPSLFPLIISFNESSEIGEIPTSLINSCKEKIILSRINKRVSCYETTSSTGSKIIHNGNNKFVSVIGKGIIMNHHPLELLVQDSHRSYLNIRETSKTIGSHAFYGNSSIRIVTIPSSVEVIDKSAFERCFFLHTVIFKNNSKLKKISDRAFESTSIKKICLPSTVEEIGFNAFCYCRDLVSASFVVDSKLKTIRKCAFFESGIISINFPSSLEEIAQYAFNVCRSLKSVSFAPDCKIESISFNCFSGTKIETIEIPSSVEEIETQAFNRCECLSSVTFGKESKLQFIRKCAFSETNIRTIEFPSSIEMIGEQAFLNCKNLSNASFANDTKSLIIDESAFDGCQCERFMKRYIYNLSS